MKRSTASYEVAPVRQRGRAEQGSSDTPADLVAPMREHSHHHPRPDADRRERDYSDHHAAARESYLDDLAALYAEAERGERPEPRI